MPIQAYLKKQGKPPKNPTLHLNKIEKNKTQSKKKEQNADQNINK